MTTTQTPSVDTSKGHSFIEDTSIRERMLAEERRESIDSSTLFSNESRSRRSTRNGASLSPLVSAMKVGTPRDDDKIPQKSVHFASDPNNPDSILVEDIKKALFLSDSYASFGMSLGHNSLLGNSGHSLDLSFASLAYDINDMDVDMLEEKIEKITTSVSSESRRQRRQCGHDSSNASIESYDANDESKSEPEKDGKENTHFRTRKRTNREKQEKFHEFYKRKDYRASSRISKHAAEEFIADNPELAQKFVNFFIASMSKDEKDITNDEIDQGLLRSWCQSDGRGLEHAILLSYLTMEDANMLPDKDNSKIESIITGLHNRRRYEQVPRLSANMAHQLALMDADIGRT